MKPILEVKNLTKEFYGGGGLFSGERSIVKAVNGISFSINKGETLGMVGESGCGKSTTGRLILRLLEPTAGEVYFDSIDILALNKKEMRSMRKRIQIIFQDPYASLNPRMTVEQIVGEALIIHKLARNKRERREQVVELLGKVGLQPFHLKRYPHEFSGGQRQRVGIARALAVRPDLIVADEPVSALDVSIQAQIINLLQDLQEDMGITYLFIAHDLSVIEHISDHVAVIYLGKIMEIAPSVELYKKPHHPYTESLLSAVPVPDPSTSKKRIVLRGDLPSPLSPPSGCPFNPRCPYKEGICEREEAELREITPGHKSACHFADKLELSNGKIK